MIGCQRTLIQILPIVTLFRPVVLPLHGKLRHSAGMAPRWTARLLLLIAAALPLAASGALQDEIQVYDDEINEKGEYSLEVHFNTTPDGLTTRSYPGQVINAGNTRLTPELAIGLGHDLEAGLYVNTVFNSGQWNYAGYKLRMKWLPILEKYGYDFFGGVNIELSNTLYQYEQSRYGVEARFILGKHIDEWLIALNPILAWPLSQPYADGNPNFSLSARVSREVTKELALGVEYYSNVGVLNQPINYQNTGQMGFLMAYWDGEPIAFQAGVGRGLSQSSDNWTIKAIFSIPLP